MSSQSSSTKKKPALKQMSARAPTIKKQTDRITISNKERTPDIAMDIIWENERGTLLFNRPTFTKKALLPTDPPSFSDLKQNYVVDIRFFQCPPNWLWVSDWILDMNGPVDEQGWSYNDTFTGPSDNWTNSTVGRRVSIVRRRKWTRMRRLKSDSSPAKLAHTGLESEMKGVEEVISLVQQKCIDRERLQAIKQYLAIESNSNITSTMIASILDEFEYDCSKLDACLLMAKIATKDIMIWKICWHKLLYFSDKMMFLKATGKGMDELISILDPNKE